MVNYFIRHCLFGIRLALRAVSSLELIGRCILCDDIGQAGLDICQDCEAQLPCLGITANIVPCPCQISIKPFAASASYGGRPFSE